MAINEVMTRRATNGTALAERPFRPKITLFHCCNALGRPNALDDGNCDIKAVTMPCSSMTRDVFLLRAFEAGADAVVIMVCPEGACRNVDGNIRAAKRVARVKQLLDEIGLGAERLNIFNVAPGDGPAVQRIIDRTVAGLNSLGPNPAA